MSKRVPEKTLNQKSLTSNLEVKDNEVVVETPVVEKPNIRPGSFSELISQ